MPKELMILVCTEGKETEKAFLKQIMKVFRISTDIVKFQVKQGAHRTLIDNCVKQRANISLAKKIPEDSIEVWAMCDRDGFKGKYSDLAKYAKANNVKLAFSSPQFESFIMQLFVRFKHNYSGKKLELELGKYLNKTKLQDGSVLRDSYSKTDLSWVGCLLDEKPSMLNAAIKNANKSNNQAKDPFFTVQDLIKSILQHKA